MREHAQFPVLAVFSASRLSATKAGGSRGEPQVQANSIILSCAMETGQTKADDALVVYNAAQRGGQSHAQPSVDPAAVRAGSPHRLSDPSRQEKPGARGSRQGPGAEGLGRLE